MLDHFHFMVRRGYRFAELMEMPIADFLYLFHKTIEEVEEENKQPGLARVLLGLLGKK